MVIKGFNHIAFYVFIYVFIETKSDTTGLNMEDWDSVGLREMWSSFYGVKDIVY